MEETGEEGLTPEMIYRPKDLVWVKVSDMWWPCEVMDQDTLDPEVTEGLKKKPLVVVKFLEEDSYEFVRSYDIIYHYNCKRKEEFLKLGFKKSFKRKNEKNMALFPKTIQEAERRTGGDPEIINDPKYLPQEAQGPSKAESGGRSSLPSDFRGKKAKALRRSAPASSMDVDEVDDDGVDRSNSRRPPIVKQGPTWYPYPKHISVTFRSSRKPPPDDPSVKQMDLHRCSVCCFETQYFEMLMLHHNNHQHNTMSTQPGKYRWRNPLNKKQAASGIKKTVVRRKKGSTPKSAEKGSAKKKKKALPPVPVGEFTPPKKPKMSLPATPNSHEVSQECAKIIEEWTDDEDESKPSDETVDKELLDCSASTIENAMETTAEAAKLGKDAEKPPILDTSPQKIDKPSGPPKSSSCFDFDEEEPSEPDLQSSGKFGQIRLPRVITPEKSKPPDPLGDGNDIDSLLNEVSVPEIPSLPPSKQDSLFSRGDRTYGSSPFKDTKKPAVTSPVKSDSSKDKNADVENNMNEEKHFLAKGPLQSKKQKSFGRTEGAEDGSVVENKSKLGASTPKPSNEREIDGKTSKSADEILAHEIAKQSLIDTLTYSPKSDDQPGESSLNDSAVSGRCMDEMSEPKKLPEDEGRLNKVPEPTVETFDSIQSAPKPSRRSGRKKSQEPAELPSTPVNDTTKREASPEESESPGSTRRSKKFKSSQKMPELHPVPVGDTAEAGVMQGSAESPSTVDTPESVKGPLKPSRKGSRKKAHMELPNLQVDETSKREACPEEPESPKSSRRNKKFRSSPETRELHLSPVDSASKAHESAESWQSPSEHALPSEITGSRKTRKLRSSDSEGEPKVQPELPSEIPELLSVPVDDTSDAGVSPKLSRTVRRKSMSHKPIESPSLPVDEVLKREASPEDPESPRSSRRNKKFKSSQQMPEQRLVPVDDTPKVDIAQDTVEIRSPSSEQVISSNDIAQEPVVRKPPSESRKTEKLGSSEVEPNMEPELFLELLELPEKPDLLSVPLESVSKTGDTQHNAETVKPSGKEARPASDVAAGRKSRKLGSSGGVLLPDLPEMVSVAVGSTLKPDLTQESTRYIKSPPREQVLPSDDIQEPVVLKSPGASGKTEKHGSSEGEQEEAVSDQLARLGSSEQLKSPSRVATLKDSAKLEEPHKSNRRSQRNRSQELPVSIPLPEDCLPKSVSAHQKVPQESCESLVSPTAHEASRSTLQTSPKGADSPQTSRRSKRVSSQELPSSIPLPEADFSSEENTTKIVESVTLSGTTDEASIVHVMSLQESSKVDESLASSKRSKKIAPAVEVPVSIPLPEKDLPKGGSALTDFIISEDSSGSSRKTRGSRAFSAASKLKISSDEPPKSDYIATDLREDSEAVKSPSTNESPTPAVIVPGDSKADEPLRSSKESNTHELPQELPMPVVHSGEESVVLELRENLKSTESSFVALIPEAVACSDSQPLHAEETHDVDDVPAAENSKPLKQPSVDKASTPVTEDSIVNELDVPSRKSKIPSEEAFMSKSPCELETSETETKASDSKSQTSSPKEPRHVEAIQPVENSEPLKSSADNAPPLEVLVEDSKANEPHVPSRKSKRISSQEVLTSKCEVDTPKTENEANDSKSQTSPAEEPCHVEAALPLENVEPVKSSVDHASPLAILMEDSKVDEPLVASRKSKRISSQEVLTSKSVCDVDKTKTEKFSEQQQSSKKSKKHKLSQEAESQLLSAVESEGLQGNLKPIESSRGDPMRLMPEAMPCDGSKSQPSAADDPHIVKSLPYGNSGPLPSIDKVPTLIMAEDSKANEPLLPSRKSRRISSREAQVTKSLFEVDSPTTETKNGQMALMPEAVECNDSKSQPSAADDPHTVKALPDRNLGPLPSVDKASTLIMAEDSKTNEPLVPSRKSRRISSRELLVTKSLFEADTTKTETKDESMPLMPEAVACSDSELQPTEGPHEVKALPDENLGPLPSVDKVSIQITAEVSKASEPVVPIRKSRRISSREVPGTKSLFAVGSPKTETAASQIPLGSLEPSELPSCDETHSSKFRPEGVPVIQEHPELNTEGSKQEKQMPEEDRSQSVEPKLPPDVTPEPDRVRKKASSGVAESRSPSKEAKSKEGRKAGSKSHRHEKSGRESKVLVKDVKDIPKTSSREEVFRSDSTSKRGSTSSEKKRKDEDERNSASRPTSHVDVHPKGSLVGDAESPTDNVAPLQKSMSDDSSSPRKKKSKWDVDLPKVVEKMDTVETGKKADSNSGAVINAGENTPSRFKPLEITVFDCSKNEIAVDKGLPESSPKKQMAHSPSKTFRHDEAASLLEELLGSSPKSSPSSSPKKSKAVSPVMHDSPVRRSRTADIKFSLSPSKVLDFGSPKTEDAGENRTENLSLSSISPQSGMADASAAPVRASRWDSPIRSSGIRSTTPTPSLAPSPAKTPHSPGRKVKVWEIKSGARSGVKASMAENNVALDTPPKQPVHQEPDSSNQSDDELSALQAEILSYSAMDQAKTTPAPVVMKDVSDLAKELEDPPLQTQTTTRASTSCSTVQPVKEPFLSPNRSTEPFHVSPKAIPLPPEPAPPFKSSGMSEADLLANLDDTISFPFEPVPAESVASLPPDTISTSKPSTTPILITVPSDSVQGSDSAASVGTERLGNGLAQGFGSGADLLGMGELLDIISIPIIMSDNLQDESMMAYSQATVSASDTTSMAVPIVSSEPVSSIPLPGEKPSEQLPPIKSTPKIPSLRTSGQVQASTVMSVTVPSVHPMSSPPEPSVQKPPSPEEASKEEIIETEIVMDHSEIEQEDSLTSAQSVEEKFAEALVKQPWLRPDLLEVLTKGATEKKVYEAKKVTQLVISLYDEDHPDYSYYMSLPPCQVGTSNFTPSWAVAGPQKTAMVAPPSTSSTNPSKTVSAVVKPTAGGANLRQVPSSTTNNGSAPRQVLSVDKSKSIVTVARPEKVGEEDSSKPVVAAPSLTVPVNAQQSGASPVKAGSQVKQSLLQFFSQVQSGKFDPDTARKLESITSRPGFMAKINQQQKSLVSSQLSAEGQPKKTAAASPVVRASPTSKTVTSVPASPIVVSPKPVVVVSSTSSVRAQPKTNMLSAGTRTEPLKFTMESKIRNIQISNSSPKFVVACDPVTGITAVKQQIVVGRNANTPPPSTVSAGTGRSAVVTTQTNLASPAAGRSAVSGTMTTFTMVAPRSTVGSTSQTVSPGPGRSNLPGKAQTVTTVNPGSSTVKVVTALSHQPRLVQRVKTVPQQAGVVSSTTRLSSQPQAVRVRKQSLPQGQTQFSQRPMTAKTDTVTYVTIPNNMVIPTGSDQVFVVNKKKPPAASPCSDILAKALVGADILRDPEPTTEDPSPDLLSPSSVVITGSLGADQLSTISFDPAETDNVNR